MAGQGGTSSRATHTVHDSRLSTIAVDLTPVLPGGENGGAKVFVLELLRVLAEIAPQTHFILLTHPASHEEVAKLDSANVSRRIIRHPIVQHPLRLILARYATALLAHLPKRSRARAVRLGYRIGSALQRLGPNTFLTDMGVDLLFCPFTAPTFFESGVPTVCTIYDLQHEDYPEFFSREDAAERQRIFLGAVRYATALAAISDFSRESIVAHGHVDPERVTTIYLRMAQRLELGQGDEGALRRLGLARERYLIYPANFWRHKNHEMLLTALGIAYCRGLPADVKLVCTGTPGERRDWLIRAADAMGLGDRVLFPGFLPDCQLAVLVAGSSGMIFPSLYEGFGLPVIEAMAVGVPVACSNTTSLPEVASDAAIMFDPRVPSQIANTLIQLVEDEPTRRRLVVTGLNRAKEFADSKRMAIEYWKLFLHSVTDHTVAPRTWRRFR